MKRKIRVSPLTVLGLILVLWGLAELYSGPGTSQYAFAPDKREIRSLLEKAEENLGESFTDFSLHGTAGGQTLSTDRKSQENVTLYQTDGSWHILYPQVFISGRPVTRADQETGSHVIVLDEQTAFQLFGDTDSIGQQVKIGESVFETIGVVRHDRRIGETDPCMAWIPLGVSGAPDMDVMVLSAETGGSLSLRSVFETAAGQSVGEGQAIHLGKERSRGTILLRAIVLVAGVWALGSLIRFAGRKSGEWIREIREKAKTCYPRQMAGYFLLRMLGMAGFAAAVIGAGAGLAVLAVEPMRVFPEWVPEILVDPESVGKRFWELTAAAAAPRQWRTPELAEIRFRSGMIRWGIVLCLLGQVHRGRREKLAATKSKG